MYPTLFQWGPFTFHTYGLLAALAFLAGYGAVVRNARRFGHPSAPAGDALLPILLGGLLGARVFYVLFHGGEFAGQWGDVFKIWRGGLMWQGGLMGGIAAGLWFFKKRRASLRLWADLFAPAVALGQGVGRLGCLFAGCCYGRACSLSWAVTFHRPDSLAPLGVALHPTQLYDAGANFFFAGLLWVLSRHSWFRPGAGRLAGLYLALTGLARLMVELFRADARGPAWAGVSVTAFVALGLCVAGGGLLWVWRRSNPA